MQTFTWRNLIQTISLVNKINELWILTKDEEPDVILITESWCNEEGSNALLNIPGYCIEPELRLNQTDTLNGIGGG